MKQPSTLASQALFRGCICMSRWPVELLRDHIPAGAQLEAQDGGFHDVIFLFGEQNNGAWLVDNRRLSSPVNYPEMLVLVPGLSHETGAVGTVVEGFCNYAPAEFVGSGFYGYIKHKADLKWAGTRFLLNTDHLTLSADVSSTRGATGKVVDTLSAYLEQPVYGVRTDGAPVISSWQIEFAHARRQLADVEFVAETTFMGRDRWTAHGLLVDPAPWTLHLPARQNQILDRDIDEDQEARP